MISGQEEICGKCILTQIQDYSLRAKDYNEKKKRLQILRQKASERNPDEFHYGMLSSRSKQGRKLADRGNPVLSQDAVKLLKTQDSGYLRTMLQKTRRALEKLEQEFILQEGKGAEVLGSSTEKGQRQHVVFVGSREEQKHYIPGKAILSPSDVREGATSRSGMTTLDGADGAEDQTISSKPRKQLSRRAMERGELARKEASLLRKKHKKERDARRSKLAALKAREKDLVDAENELELQRAKMSNSVGGVTKAGLKWKVRERKK